MTATSRGAKRVESDYYPTPAPFVRAILPHLPLAGSILEPMAGDGAIVRVLVAAGRPCVDMIEIDPARAAMLGETGADGAILVGDALGFESTCLWDMPHGLVITNPAFSLAQVLAERSIRAQLQHGGTTALLVPQSFLGTAGRREFWSAHPCDWYQCFQRPEFVASMGCSAKKTCAWRETLPIDAYRPKMCPACGAKTTCSTTDAREYGWAVWGPGRGGRLFWLAVEGERT